MAKADATRDTGLNAVVVAGQTMTWAEAFPRPEQTRKGS